MRPLPCSLLFSALLLASPAHADTRIWPGIAPCATTLQACIDGSANGDRIEVVSSNPINEDITLANRSLQLVGDTPLGQARFAPVRSMAITGNTNGLSVLVSGFRFTDATVLAQWNGTGTGNIELRNLSLENASAGGSHITVYALAGTLNATLYNNQIRSTPTSMTNYMLVDVAALNSILNLDARFNRIAFDTVPTSGGSGISYRLLEGSDGRAVLFGNEVRTRTGASGSQGIVIGDSRNAAGSDLVAWLYNNVVIGDGSVLYSKGISIQRYGPGSITAQVLNNTLVNLRSGLDLHNIWVVTSPPVITVLAKNNLISATTTVDVPSDLATGVTQDYNLHHGTPPATPGTHSIFANPQLVDANAPRLQATSPAHDAADTASLAVGLIVNNLPALDADGLRRIKGSDDKADIGAYEYGDVSFGHETTAANSTGHITFFNHPSVTSAPTANVFATPVYRSVEFPSPYGVYWGSTPWKLFAQNMASMPIGAGFSAFVPAPGAGVFRHQATTGNASNYSKIDNSSTNNQPDQIVLVSQNWSAFDSMIYNNHHIGIAYLTDITSQWAIATMDNENMNTGAAFNIYAQPPSPNAFRVTAIARNLATMSGIVIDHPLLNGQPCARVQATRLRRATPLSAGFDLFYANDIQRWMIYGHNHDSGAIIAGDQFNVVIDPAQIYECSRGDALFANGFE